MNEIIIGGILICAAVFIAFRWGKSAQANKQLKGHVKSARKQTKAAIKSPRGKDAVVDRIRKSGL